MRISLFLCFTIGFVGKVFAQVDYNVSKPLRAGGEVAYITLSTGASIPIQDFRSKDIKNSEAGFAKTGMMLDLDFALNVSKGFGLMATFYGQQNQIESKSTADLFSPTQAVGSSGANLSNRNVTTKPWYLGSGMLGIFLSIKLANYVYMRPRFMGGLAFGYNPEVYVEVIGGSKLGDWTKQESKQSESVFSYLLGLDFKFDISRNACLMVNLDYMATKPKFNDIVVQSNDILNSYKYSRSQQFKMFNFGLGFGVNLFRS